MLNLPRNVWILSICLALFMSLSVFIGSDTQLIAPVTIGENATIGAGSTITQDVPSEKLTLSRKKQKTIPNWKREK